MQTDNYVTKEESEAILAKGKKLMAQRLKQGDMRPANVTKRDGVLIIDDMYPMWQFLSEVYPTVKRVLDALEGDAWKALNFYDTPMGALNGKTPLHALITHAATHERIIELAEASLY